MADINENLKHWAESRGIASLPSATNENLLRWAANKAVQESKSAPVEVQQIKLASTPSKTVTAQEKAVQEVMDNTTPAQRLASVKNATTLPVLDDIKQDIRETVASELPTLVQSNVQNINDQISALKQEKAANTGNRLQTGLTVAQSQAKAKEYDERIAELEEQRRALTGEEKFSAGKLLGGVAVKGADEFVSGLTSTAAWLENMTLGKLFPGTTDNSPIQAINDRVQQAKAHNQEYTAGNVAAGGKAAEVIDKYGTSTVAAIPQALLALYTGGASSAAQGTTAGLQAASSAAQAGSGLMSTVKSAVTSLQKDPQYWFSFAQVAGNSYDQAKADGADDTRASLYALGNGLMNAAVEVGGGIETLPTELQAGKSAFKTWVDSMLDEGKEEVVQGVLERGLQNLIYNKDNPLAGIEDENAILNPKTAGEEFLGGAVVGGILGGAQTGINAALNAAARNRVTAMPGSGIEGAQSIDRTVTELPRVEQVNTDTTGTESAVEGVQGQNNTASTGETEYRAAKPENVEMPTVPIINLSMQDVANLNGGELPNTGNYVRKAAIEKARKDLGLDQNSAVYIPASNVMRNGEEYVLKITRSSLDKMLSPSNGGIVSPESIAVLDNLERIANNGVYFQSEGDRQGRDQIAGYDHLATTVYIDGQPYSVDMRVRVYDEKSGGENRLYYFTPEEIVTTKKVGTDFPTGTLHERAISQETVPTSNTNIRENTAGVNRNSAQTSQNDASNKRFAMSADGLVDEVVSGDYGRNTVKGASINEQQTGAISDRGPGRISDQRTGGEAFQQRAGAEYAGRSTAVQSKAAIERQNRANGLWGDKVSSKSLGVFRGTDDAVLSVMPENTWDTGMKNAAEQVKAKTGLDVTYVTGGIQVVGRDGTARLVRGVYTGKGIIVQADNLRVSVEQIADHEIFHDLARQSPGLVSEVKERIREQYDRNEFERVVETYIAKLRGVIDVENGSTQFEIDDALRDIYEEVCADAYAGINAFSAHAERYQEAARNTVMERGFTDRTRNGAAATERTTGPPERFSVEDLPGVKRNADGTWQFPDGSTDIDTYTENQMRRAEQAKAERMRDKSREEFKGSPALEKLGVKVDNSVGSYEHIRQLIANDRAARMVTRELKRAEKRLNATDAERNFASGIAAGIYTEADVPATMDADKVMELADYYWAAEATGQNLIRQQRAEISRSLSWKMDEIMRNVDADSVELPKGFTLNHRTPTRNMTAIFGDEAGGKLNDFLFKPAQANESERLRFVNRMYDEVRTFRDSKGKQKELTRTERAVVQQVMEGKAAEELVFGSKRSEIIQNAAENIRKSGDVNDAVQEFHLTSEERKLARQYARWLETQETMASGKVDAVKVENAVKKYSEMFDQFYDATNEFLVAHGYEPIGFIKGYAPHIQTDETQNLLNKAFKSMGLSADVSALPTSIAGQTANYKPNKRWNPFHQHRMGENTHYDIAAGYETYVDYMSDILYHTDDIMRVRQASEYFRRRYAPENIRENLEWAEELRYASTERKANYLRDNGVISRTSALSAEDVNRLMDEYVDRQYEDIQNTTKFSDLVMWLDDYANKQAGKQLFADRNMERTVGRVSLNVGRKLTQTFARAKVAGNLSSALNQASQLTIILGENGARYTAAAVRDNFTGKLRKNNWAQESDFLTEKKGINYIVNTPSEMMTTALFKPLEFTDSLMATMAVRGRYLKEINAGKSHAEAMKAADTYGRNVMGSRSKSSAPLAFQQKDLVSQMLHVFQLEAANSWDHLRVDMQQDFRQIQAEKGKAAAVGALAGVIVKMLLSAFVLNRIDEELYGGTPAQFDLLGLFTNFVASGEGLTTNEYLRTVIDNGWEKLTGERLFDTEELDPDDEFDWGSALEDTAYNVGNDIPYLRNAMGLLGLGDETLPMPDLYGAGKNVYSAVKDHGVISAETGKAVLGAVTEILPGGNQLNKTAQGIEAFVRGGDYSGYGENERLKYPLDDSVGTAVKSVLFGKTKTDAAGKYYASGASALSTQQTQVYRSLVEQGADRQEVYGAIQEYREIDNDKELTSYERGLQERELIRALDLSDEQKLELYQGLTGADSRAEKFRALMETGLSWDEVMDAFDEYSALNEEDTAASAKAQQFAKWVGMQGYTVRQAEAVKTQLTFYSIVAASAERYEDLTEVLTGAGMSQQDALNAAEEYIGTTKGLTADKDANGKTIAGSKKEKVVAAIDSMSLTSAQKDSLFLAEGYAESGLEDTPWHAGTAKYTLPIRDWSQVTELPRAGG